MATKPDAPDLTLAFHRLSDADLDTEFLTGGVAGRERMPLRELVTLLKATYTSKIGAEFMHITDAEQRRWMYERLEGAAGRNGQSKAQKVRILERLTAAEGLERYLHTKYVGQKRFSLEGGDALIPMLDIMVRRAGDNGVRDVVVGMAHRGRLNVLVNTLGKPPRKLFDEFEGKFEHHSANRAHTGDVKYHMGFSADLATPGGPVHVALAFNPSHLEIVDPVVVGSVRSRQNRRDDKQRTQVLPVLLHGDAAFAGQGVVMELLQMSQARGFAVGGTVHIVINNQIGFTTSAADDARSTLYCTDVAKMVGAPVLHVNGDAPEAVAFCTELAFDFRQRFGKDVVIDLVCYRRHGHNEADEPAATQPLMYQAIRAHKTVRELYGDQLVAEGVLAAEAVKSMMDAYRDKLDAGEVTVEVADVKPDEFSIDWSQFLHGKVSDPVDTRIDRAKLDALASSINTIPAEIVLHPRVAKIYDDRRKMVAGELPGDWGFAENLAYATLVDQGYKLRLVGQDSAVARSSTATRSCTTRRPTRTTCRCASWSRIRIRHDHRLAAQRGSRHGLRVRLFDGRPDDARYLGSAIRRFRQRRAGRDRPVPVVRRSQVGSPVRLGVVPAARLRRPRAGTQFRAPGALPAAVRAGQHDRVRADDACAGLPHDPPPDADAHAQATGGDDAKSLLRHKLAVSTLDELANGTFQALIPDSTVEREESTPRRHLRRQGLLRPARGSAQAGHHRRRAGARGAAVSVPAPRAQR